VEHNLATCTRLANDAKAAGASLLCLPECFAFIGARAKEAQNMAEPLGGPLLQRYRELARDTGLWLSLGGFQEKPEGYDSDPERRIYNTHCVINPAGELRAAYRKIHLFDAPFVKLVESAFTLPGEEVVACDCNPVGRLGLSVCYDVRFPELYQSLKFGKGADVLLVPAAFTVPTGKAHWELLLRTRAIENQAYVIAAAQAGLHNEDGNRRESYGHAMIIDPWGQVLAKLEDPIGTGVAVAEIDVAARLGELENKMPLAVHRRYGVYGGISGSEEALQAAAALNAYRDEVDEETRALNG
jgi:predicted amidohydrolase